MIFLELTFALRRKPRCCLCLAQSIPRKRSCVSQRMGAEKVILRLIDRARSRSARRRQHKNKRGRWQVVLYDPSLRNQENAGGKIKLSAGPDDFLNTADNSVV